MKNILVVVDIQNDFVDGALGTPEAAAIINNAANKIKKFVHFCGFGSYYKQKHKFKKGVLP